MQTWHIHIAGQVQGVGFRPFIYSLAQKYGLNGWVNNAIDGVHIAFNADEQLALAFKEKIRVQAPSLSEITSLQLWETEQEEFSRFEIVHSDRAGAPNLLLTPDFALCPACRKELKDKQDPRHTYPFITCTNCGPRFSIVDALPYDRVHTKMATFEMCPACESEYQNPLDRRYYSQTNSCPSCGITLTLYDANQHEISSDTEEVMKQVVHHWKAGKIVAIKGIGGYLLTCDAANELAVTALRKRKHRPSKPFALMYPNSGELNEFLIGEKGVSELESYSAPILLLDKKASAKIATGIAPGLTQIGVMLPYTPLFELLLADFGRPIVATSGNRSRSPIVYQDEKALHELSAVADFILLNNREIIIPQDDSVIRYSFFDQRRIILRRSRGFAPTYINPKLAIATKRVLAMGAMLKSTFTLCQSGNTYISQYLGDLASFDAQQNYHSTIQHFLELFQTKPEMVLSDKHADYPSSQLGKQLADEWEVPTQSIQHHKAHFGAVLGEHNLLQVDFPVLGVIWDGTGLGDDGQIWGGEFFTYAASRFERHYHFDYFNFILGDKMPKEPRISALSACWQVEGSEDILREKFTDVEWQIYSKLLDKDNSLKTSSVGRIFDAVASLLEGLDKQTYEGEAAMRLETLATTYCKQHGLFFLESYFPDNLKAKGIPTRTLMASIIADLQADKAKGFVAAKFHFSLVKLIKAVANKLNVRHLAFSGGVFQNGLLVDLISYHLGTDFTLFFHDQLSPNDENISFGQLVCHQIENYRHGVL